MTLSRLTIQQLLPIRLSSLAAIIVLSGCSQKVPANDALFLDALQVAGSGNPALLDQYQGGLQNSVLQYYPDYWKLNNNLAMQPAAAIVGFARRYPRSAMAEKLAADYLEEKAKAGDFATAAPVVPFVSNADTSENCAIAQIQAATGDPLALISNKNIWLTTENQPETCQALTRMMLNSPLLTVADKQQRLFTVLRAGLIGPAFATANSMGMPLSLTTLNQIQANPSGYLWTAPKTTAQDHAYLIFALGRLASQDLNNALVMVDKVAAGTPENIQKYLNRTVAYIGGNSVLKNGFNSALPTLFDKSYGYPFSPEEAEIYARQSIRFGQWESVLRAIGSMSNTQQQEPRWQYWRARAAEQRNTIADKRYAHSIYQRLATTDDDYHGLLARDRINNPLQSAINTEPSNADMARLNQDLNFQRAFALKMIGAPADYSTREWNWAVRQAVNNKDDGLLLAAAKRANAMGWYDRGIYAADRTISRHNHALSYPMPYRVNVVSGSQVANITPAWAYGIIRQESRFTINARSNVGANGLMQVMPDTAKLIARKMGEPFDAGYMQPETNIRYGTYYLGMVQRQLSDSMVLATAGYNAGPNRAKAWQPAAQNLAADQYIESIPIKETRDYVKNVMNNTVHYGVLLGQGSQPISRYLSVITPNN